MCSNLCGCFIPASGSDPESGILAGISGDKFSRTEQNQNSRKFNILAPDIRLNPNKFKNILRASPERIKRVYYIWLTQLINSNRKNKPTGYISLEYSTKLYCLPRICSVSNQLNWSTDYVRLSVAIIQSYISLQVVMSLLKLTFIL